MADNDYAEKNIPGDTSKLFGVKDFDSPLTTREYLQARSIEETSRLQIGARNTLVVAIMYIILALGLFGMLFYVNHLQYEAITNATVITTERNIQNSQTSVNLIQLCNFMHKMSLSYQDTINLMIADPNITKHPNSEYILRLKKIQAIKATFDKQLVPACYPPPIPYPPSK
jgi:hypothetical protein